jgi:hypothetical protein
MSDRILSTRLAETFEPYLQDKGKSPDGKSGSYRRNAARELERFAEWSAGDCSSDDRAGITPDDVDRDPSFGDLNERVFYDYARYLADECEIKENTVETYYRYISAWCGWCVNNDYLEIHYAHRASTMAIPFEKDNRELKGVQRP